MVLYCIGLLLLLPLSASLAWLLLPHVCVVNTLGCSYEMLVLKSLLVCV